MHSTVMWRQAAGRPSYQNDHDIKIWQKVVTMEGNVSVTKVSDFRKQENWVKNVINIM